MLRRLSATPCPVNKGTIDNRRDSITSEFNDTTTNLDYTTEFKASFRDVKPRRPPPRKGRAPAVDFVIHEDHELHVNRSPARDEPYRNGQNLIGLPPQRPGRRVSFSDPMDTKNGSPKSNQPPKSSLTKAPKRVSVMPGPSASKPRIHLQEDTLPRMPCPQVSKPPRRGTIYIPNDDTTMPSMYMGIFSPLKMSDEHSNGPEKTADHSVNTIATQMAKKRKPRQSTLTISPERVPLRIEQRPHQAAASIQDHPGKPTGKENVPPGFASTINDHATKAPDRDVLPIAAIVQHPPTKGPSRLFEPTASSNARLRPNVTSSKTAQRPPWKTGARTHPLNRVFIREETNGPGQSTEPFFFSAKPNVPTRFIGPVVKTEPISAEFPLLPEGLHNVAMYENNWLSQQEIAITQLGNSLMEASSINPRPESDHSLVRVKLNEIYGHSESALMYKRVQAGLLYGALSFPQHEANQEHRLFHDMGHRMLFVDLWLKTYDPSLLRAALEVIIGRLSGRTSESLRTSTGENNERRRGLKTFIDKFLIRSEGAAQDPKAWNYASASIHRTLLRSLMLIKLLDSVKTNAQFTDVPSLFLTTSPHKSSSSVLFAVMQMLNPSAGDPTRPLTHLGYVVSHSQYPLEEYDYHIKNLAVDLRDGVRLTRLVELLLYRSASRNLAHRTDIDDTTLCMPTGEVFSLIEGESDWPLSQHLKFPCLSRATKIFNVQIALSAIQNVKGMDAILHDIRAEDIVDGFREKTVRLLWGLTSKWGIGGLVDWDDVRQEVKRLGRARDRVGNYHYDAFDLDDADEEHIQYKSLLKAWAKAVALKHGFAVQNFTTSFADGKVFRAIVGEYQTFLGAEGQSQSTTGLQEQLKALGCSEQFTLLFETGTGSTLTQHFYDRDFVIASLAFLCSRLLGPSKKARAAVAIQGAWRKRRHVLLQNRKMVLKSLAESCMMRSQNLQSAKVHDGGRKDRIPDADVSSTLRGAGNLTQEVDSKEEDIWLSL